MASYDVECKVCQALDVGARRASSLGHPGAGAGAGAPPKLHSLGDDAWAGAHPNPKRYFGGDTGAGTVRFQYVGVQRTGSTGHAGAGAHPQRHSPYGRASHAYSSRIKENTCI